MAVEFNVIAASEGRDPWKSVRAITTDHSDNIHHLICRDCGAEYRGVPNECPHCQDGWMH